MFLALKSGEMAADAVEAALRKGSVAAGEFAAYGETLCNSIEVMRKMVYAFYDEGFSFGRLIKKHSSRQNDTRSRNCAYDKFTLQTLVNKHHHDLKSDWCNKDRLIM